MDANATRIMAIRQGVPNMPSALPSQLDERRKLVGEFVANAFYGVMMKQMHESKLKGSLFHGGRGEEAFQGLLAQEISKRIGQSPTDPLANKFNAALEKRPGGAMSAAAEMR